MDKDQISCVVMISIRANMKNLRSYLYLASILRLGKCEKQNQVHILPGKNCGVVTPITHVDVQDPDWTRDLSKCDCVVFPASEILQDYDAKVCTPGNQLRIVRSSISHMRHSQHVLPGPFGQRSVCAP